MNDNKIRLELETGYHGIAGNFFDGSCKTHIQISTKPTFILCLLSNCVKM